MNLGSRLIPITKTTDFAPFSRKEFLNIQTTKDCGFNLKFVRDMTKTYSQMPCKDKYSHVRSIICSLLSNGGVFVYELNGCGFETNCSYLKFRFRFCFAQRVAQHSDNDRLCI